MQEEAQQVYRYFISLFYYIWDCKEGITFFNKDTFALQLIQMKLKRNLFLVTYRMELLKYDNRKGKDNLLILFLPISSSKSKVLEINIK